MPGFEVDHVIALCSRRDETEDLGGAAGDDQALNTKFEHDEMSTQALKIGMRSDYACGVIALERQISAHHEADRTCARASTTSIASRWARSISCHNSALEHGRTSTSSSPQPASGTIAALRIAGRDDR